jgi:predicted transcriptional regulator
MKIKSINDAAKKKAAQAGKVVDLKIFKTRKEARAAQVKRLREVRTIARRMGVDTRNATMIELIKAIQKTEGNKDCFRSAQALTCQEKNCLWCEDCVHPDVIS